MFFEGLGGAEGPTAGGSLRRNLPVFSLENGLFYMFYSLLKHTISTHFRQFEMQKRSEPHLNCFDDLFGEKETASYFRNYFQLLLDFFAMAHQFCWGSWRENLNPESCYMYTTAVSAGLG